MRKLDFRNLKPAGKCPVCGINTWKETGNEPAIFPCGLEHCPYEKDGKKRRQKIEFERSAVGNSLALIV